MAAVRRANDLGFLTVVVTNQSGVARGLYTEAEIVALHGWMQAQLGEAGAHIDAFYYCPHHPEGSDPAYRVDCDCRKPLPGMLLRAARELDIDLTASILIGDSPRDITAAEAAGATGYLFRDGDLSTFFNALLVDRLRRAKTVCVGDVMLDEFIYGDVNRISPEAPVPVLRTDRHRSMLGGAGNAVRNMAALGSQVTLLSVTGDDQSGSAVAELCKALPECDAVLLREPGRVTPTKTRFVAHSQQLLRADRGSTAPVSEALLGQLLQGFSESLKYASAVLLSDYAKGKTVILDFWATWCGPCQQAMPHYEEISRRYAAKGVVVLGVCAFDTRAAYDKWVVAHREKYTFPTVFDPVGKPASGDKEASARTVMMQLTGGVLSPLPTTLVINAEGKFVGMYAGYGANSHDALANLLMLAGIEVVAADQPKKFYPAGSTIKPPVASVPKT